MSLGSLLDRFISYVRHILLFLYYLFNGHPCSKCTCQCYDDSSIFDSLRRRSKSKTYAQSVLDSGELDRVLKCDVCGHKREEHGMLSHSRLTPDFMPNGGAVLIEKMRRESERRKKFRFAKDKDSADATKSSVQPSTTRQCEVEELQVGDGESIEMGDQVQCHYDAYVLGDAAPFESTKNKQPFVFTLGAGTLVEGWDKGVVGMRVGGRRRITVPPSLAYKEKKIAGRRHVTVVFDINIIALM